MSVKNVTFSANTSIFLGLISLIWEYLPPLDDLAHRADMQFRMEPIKGDTSLEKMSLKILSH